MSSDRRQAQSGLSVTTLMIASCSSLAAAVVVSRIWGPGTLIGAGATPVIVALVSEALKRPARVIDTVRETRSARYDPVAEGRRGLAEGDLERARPIAPTELSADVATYRVARAGRGPADSADSESVGRRILRLPRPRVLAAVGTGLVAFVVAGVFLTSSELVLGKSVTSSAKRTTLVPVKRSTSTTKTQTDTTPKDTTTTQTTTTTGTTPTTPTTSTAPTTTAVPPAQTTPAPQAQSTPAGPAAPPATTPAQPAAPDGSVPPPTTP